MGLGFSSPKVPVAGWERPASSGGEGGNPWTGGFLQKGHARGKTAVVVA
jgi:hypothetical protein